MTPAQKKAQAAIVEWRLAFTQANNAKPPRVDYKSGWIIFDGGRKVRSSELEAMTQRLRVRVAK